MKTSIQCPKGYEVQEQRKQSINDLFSQTVSFVRSVLTDRALNPNADTIQHRDLILSVLNAETL